MSDLGSPEEKGSGPYFPPPRKPEQPSPYRERLPPAIEIPGRARTVVTRPDPPDHPAPPKSLHLPLAWPAPRGGRLVEGLRASRVFVANHPFLAGLIVLLILALWVAINGRGIAMAGWMF